MVLGGNDALRGVPQEETFHNLSVIIDRIQLTGAAVVLVGVRGGLVLDPYKGAFEELSAKKRTYYVPDVMESIWGNPSRLADTVHPNDRGHQYIVNRLVPVLERVLQEG